VGWNIVRTDTPTGGPTYYQDPEGPDWQGYVEFGLPGAAPGAGKFRVDQAGNVTVSGTVTGNVTVPTLTVTYGSNTGTGTSANILTALGATSGTATQLSDLFRDYMVYLEVTTTGTATSLTMGHTNAASDVTLISSAAATAGTLWSFRLPAGWYFKWTGTTTAVGNQVAVSC
jgi:hypothetical protein